HETVVVGARGPEDPHEVGIHRDAGNLGGAKQREGEDQQSPDAAVAQGEVSEPFEPETDRPVRSEPRGEPIRERTSSQRIASGGLMGDARTLREFSGPRPAPGTGVPRAGREAFRHALSRGERSRPRRASAEENAAPAWQIGPESPIY